MRRTPDWITRRSLLTALGGLCVLSAGCEDAEGSEPELWVSAHGADDASFGLVVAGPLGVVSIIKSGFRGHDVTVRPGHPQRVMMFGRKPGRFAVDVDLTEGRVVRRLEVAGDRALQGHGCFTPDGTLLITAEADVDTGAGKLAVRDADTFQVLRELDTYGIGPHEIALMPDERTIVVANGGLFTLPESGDTPLNLDTMRSSLAYVDLASGELVEEALFVEPKASIRHLDVCDDGTVVAAMQVQREAMDHDGVVALGLVHRRGEAARALDPGEGRVAAMKDYTGSVAVDQQSRVAGLTSPRGNMALFWDIDTGALVGELELFDVCGIAVSPDQARFVLTGGNEQVRQLDGDTLAPFAQKLGPLPGVRWDNHLIALPGRSQS